MFKKYASQRVFQNKQIYLDDESNVVPDDVIVYQDLMVFKNLFKGSYFGGRALVAERNMKNVKKQIKRENNLFSNAQTNSYYNKHLHSKYVSQKKARQSVQK